MVLLFIGLLLAQAAVSGAQSFTLAITGGNWLSPGIASDHGRYQNTFIPFVSEVEARSDITFGEAITTENTGRRPSADTFTNVHAEFEFDLTDNVSGITRHFVVEGAIVGPFDSAVGKMKVSASGRGGSRAAFRATSITVDGATVFTTIADNPLGIPSIRARVVFGGTVLQLFVDRTTPLMVPGDFGAALPINGYLHIP